MTTLDYRYIREENSTVTERRLAAIRWARRALRPGVVVVLDTENTGRPGEGFVCELSVIDTAGVIRLDSLVNPGHPIESAARRCHLTDQMVVGAPAFRQVLSRLLHVTAGAVIAAYNGRAAFHTILRETRRAGMDPEHLEDPAGWHCISQARSDWLGHPHHYLPPPVAHRALDRCHATLNVLRDIAADRTTGSTVQAS